MNSEPILPVSLDDVPLPDELPPIVLVAFTRPDLLKEVLAALGQQSLLPQRILAFVDGPRSEKDQPAIDQCISLLEAFSGTVPVEIHQREANLGCDRNVISALTEVFSRFSALIYLEDDVVPNPCFYDRMCRLLEAYRDYPQVFSVTAYANYPKGLNQLIQTDFMVSHRVFALGLGTWRDRWQGIDLMQRSHEYNPFGHFYQIPATVQTKYTMVNQFFLEKNRQSDWVITLTLAALHKGQVHITPMTSFVRNIGFGHPEAKTYRGSEPHWANAHYDPSARPNSLPTSLEPIPELANPIDGVELAQHLENCQGLWLSPTAVQYFLSRYQGWSNQVSFLKLFLTRAPILLRRWRSRLPV